MEDGQDRRVSGSTPSASSRILSFVSLNPYSSPPSLFLFDKPNLALEMSDFWRYCRFDTLDIT